MINWMLIFPKEEAVSMSLVSLRLSVIALVYCASQSLAQPPATQLNPAVKKIVDEVSEERIGAIMKKLGEFGTRYVASDQDNPAHGIGGASNWILDQFKSYSPRLAVNFQKFTIPKTQRTPRDLDLVNVVAVLPGTIDKDRYVIISSHYDSIAARRAPNQPVSTDDAPPASAADTDPLAPGVADDASGTAATMELARVMSQYTFDKSIVFVTFAAEEIGLNGSKAFAAKAKEDKMQIEGVLNNDIIGSDVAGNGMSANNRLRVFSEGPEDSTSRSLARYTKEIAERYVPSMTVDLIFRHDRFGRGSDHTSFVAQGFAAVRLTTPSENFANQHTATDTFANASVPYTARVAKMNAAVLATLALAPKPPVVAVVRPAGGTRGGGAGAGAPGGRGGRGGPPGPGLSRGKGYDAVARWTMPAPEPDLAGYAILVRDTTAPLWQREIYVGNVTEYTMPDMSIDDVVIGVRAIDKDGNPSLISAYVMAPTRMIETTPPPTPARPTGGQ
jgi:Peptidase family M28